jgi:hypothetical protein
MSEAPEISSPVLPALCSVSARTYETSGGLINDLISFPAPIGHSACPLRQGPASGNTPLLLLLIDICQTPAALPSCKSKPHAATFQNSTGLPRSQAAVPPTCLSRPSRSILALARAPSSVASPAHAAERGSSFSAARPPALPAPQDRTRPSWRSTSQHRLEGAPSTQARFSTPRRNDVTKRDARILWH